MRETKEFENKFEVTVNVSVQMAMIIFAGRFDVYGRKIAHPHDLTRDLFAAANNSDEEEYVAWVTGEVTTVM